MQIHISNLSAFKQLGNRHLLCFMLKPLTKTRQPRLHYLRASNAICKNYLQTSNILFSLNLKLQTISCFSLKNISTHSEVSPTSIGTQKEIYSLILFLSHSLQRFWNSSRTRVKSMPSRRLELERTGDSKLRTGPVLYAPLSTHKPTICYQEHFLVNHSYDNCLLQIKICATE